MRPFLGVPMETTTAIGTVTADNGDGTCAVTVLGAALVVDHLKSYKPVVNDPVAVLFSGTTAIVLGAAGPYAGGGGGDDGLNDVVFSPTEPADPNHGTIWVKT